MAANRTFATLVAKCLVEMNLGDPSSPDLTSSHADTVRRALIDAQRRHRKKALDFLVRKTEFTPNSGDPSYTLASAPVSTRFTRIDYLQYEFSDGSLTPPNGMEASDFVDVWKRLQDDAATDTFDYVDCWTVRRGVLWIAPRPDASVNIHLHGFDSDEWSYEWNEGTGEWDYRVNGTVSADIDAITSEPWLDDGGDLLVASALAKLYLGPYRDEKGLLAGGRLAEERDELDSHKYTYELQGRPRRLERWGF